MKRGLTAVIVCCTLALVSACGGSANSSSSGSSASSSTGTTAAGGKTGTSGTSKAGLQVDTTPKFASPSKGASVQSGVVQIAYRDITIDPDTVRVKLGSTIKWTNYDTTQANVTSVSGPLKFASNSFGEGGTFELKASKVGVIHYECTFYPTTMNGTIEVVS
jgi:plastocyanin